MIEVVHFENFKAIRSAHIPLGRLTVFVGPNASGKSTVLQGVHLLTQLKSWAPWQAFSGHQHPAVLQTSGVTDSLKLQIDGRYAHRATPCKVHIALTPPAPGGASQQTDWEYDFRLLHGEEDDTQHGKMREPTDIFVIWNVGPNPAWEAVWPAVLLRLDAAWLAEPSSSEEPTSMIEANGSGLASVLAEMAATRPDELEGIQDAVRGVVPAFRRLRLERAKVQRTETEKITVDNKAYTRVAEREVWGYRLIVDMEGAEGIPAHAVSEGTLLTIGLLSVLMNPERPRLLLLENLERGLHPQALGDLVAQLRAILERYPELQIIGTSHSPYLLDHLDTKEVRCSTVGPDGYAEFAMLSDHPDFDRWKDAMRPGEFWSTVGHQWIADAAAAKANKQSEPKASKTKTAPKKKGQKRKASDG